MSSVLMRKIGDGVFYLCGSLMREICDGVFYLCGTFRAVNQFVSGAYRLPQSVQIYQLSGMHFKTII